MEITVVAVFDTNILVRLALKWARAIDRLWHALRNQVFVLVLSASILAELERVLNYPRIQHRYDLDAEQITSVLNDLREIVTLTEEAYEVSRVQRDPTDDIFLACALEAYADYLVTEDNHLLSIKQYHGVQIIGLEQFQKIIKF